MRWVGRLLPVLELPFDHKARRVPEAVSRAPCFGLRACTVCGCVGFGCECVQDDAKVGLIIPLGKQRRAPPSRLHSLSPALQSHRDR